MISQVRATAGKMTYVDSRRTSFGFCVCPLARFFGDDIVIFAVFNPLSEISSSRSNFTPIRSFTRQGREPCAQRIGRLAKLFRRRRSLGWGVGSHCFY
jgi:hypothetical protein